MIGFMKISELAIKGNCLFCALRKRSTEIAIELTLTFAHNDLGCVGQSNHIGGGKRVHLGWCDRELGKDLFIGSSGLPARVETCSWLERVSEMFEVRDTTADARLPFQQTNINASRGE